MKKIFIKTILVTTFILLTIIIVSCDNVNKEISQVKVIKIEKNDKCKTKNDIEKENIIDKIEEDKIEEIKENTKITNEQTIDDYFLNLENNIIEKVSQYGENIGLSFYDIKNDKSISINGDKYFIAASTSKVPLNMVLYDKVFNNEIKLDSKIDYNNAYFEDGTGIIQEDIQDDYSIETLANYSIIYSDNIATNMLYDYLGGYSSVRNEFNKYLGYEAEHSGNKITPNQATTYLKILYENKNNNKYYNLLIDNLKNTIFKIRMEQDLIGGLVAHKIGSYETTINDIGIIYANNPFIISIYTNDITNADNLITEITNFIYKEQQENYPD